MRVKKNLSIEDFVLKKAEDRAEQLGMKFSAYITTLINKDLGEIAVTETKKETGKLPESVKSGINNILGED